MPYCLNCHEDLEDEDECNSCGTQICQECSIMISDEPHCKKCYEKLKDTCAQCVSCFEEIFCDDAYFIGESAYCETCRMKIKCSACGGYAADLHSEALDECVACHRPVCEQCQYDCMGTNLCDEHGVSEAIFCKKCLNSKRAVEEQDSVWAKKRARWDAAVKGVPA